ncbi:MAG: sugar ABC transporter substrate-binding protein, partial [Clostridia bacterium]|nr:sugar ABC transporter substrate-binding protein [Clostridia bacterium]
VITCCISAGQSDVYKEGVEFFNGQAIYSKIVEMGSHVPIVEQNDYHYTCRQYIGAAIQEILMGSDVETALKNAEDQLRFAMGL